ncbi:glycosyltransferase [Okeanomitos corallinicola TIOX110]|uniref:Glycosyltransferase n=1 Tax=Okeanomitos corallinicola TIOX110 TaxID=3133117 RepID=A0ABZ2UVJ1_9CYAN
MKILFLSDSYMQDGSFDPFRKEVLQAISLYGSETKAVITNHFLYSNSSNIRFFQNFNKVVEDIRKFNPDIIFSINRAGLVKELTDVISTDAVYITWFIDSYERVPENLLKFTTQDIVWLTGLREYTDNFCCRYGVKTDKIIFSPFATNTDVFYPQNQERTIDGCFVGTAFSNQSFVNTLNCVAEDVEERNILIHILESHKSNYIFDIATVLQEKGYTNYEEHTRENWQMIFDDQISIEKRIRFISTLHDFNIKIYGEPNHLWIQYLSIYKSSMLAKYQYEPIRTPEDLAHLYNKSKIGINILHHQASNHSLPIRVFDLMACKTLLLTEKTSVNALHQIGFIENVDFVCFEDEKDLKHKFEFYLKNDTARDKIVESAYLKVKNFHSLKIRIEEGISRSLGEKVNVNNYNQRKIEVIDSSLFKLVSLEKREKYLHFIKKHSRFFKKSFPGTWEVLRITALKLKILR